MKGQGICDVRISCKGFCDKEHLCYTCTGRVHAIKIVMLFEHCFLGDVKLTKGVYGLIAKYNLFLATFSFM